MRDFLDAVPTVDPSVRGQLFDKVCPLISDLPSNLQAERAGTELQQQGIQVDYFYPSGKDVALETLAKMQPKANGVVPQILMNVPQKEKSDRFALRFTGNLVAPKSGKYTLSVASDDGSRIYLNNKLLVSNTDAMPHNFAITLPGALQEVGQLAEATGRDADAMERHFIPRSDKILLSSKLLQPGENQALSFDVPNSPAVYPYVSLMPNGLLDKLTREEILDLIAFVYAKGDNKHMLFGDHQHH
jgi:hypothetical protein